MDHTSLVRLYSKVCDCNSINCKTYAEIINCPSKGSPPRGFYTEPSPHKKVLVVGKNPGHALSIETDLYKNLKGNELVSAHWSFSRDTFYKLSNVETKELGSTRFHTNLISYLTQIIDCPKEDIFKYAAYTNLVKCSTPNEQALLSRKTMSECFNNHLLNEIKYFNPTLIFALGREVERFIKATLSIYSLKIKVAYIKHPSYFYKKEIRDSKIQELMNIYKLHKS